MLKYSVKGLRLSVFLSERRSSLNGVLNSVRRTILKMNAISVPVRYRERHSDRSNVYSLFERQERHWNSVWTANERTYFYSGIVQVHNVSAQMDSDDCCAEGSNAVKSYVSTEITKIDDLSDSSKAQTLAPKLEIVEIVSPQ